MKAMGVQIVTLQEQNKRLTEALAKHPLTATTKALQDAETMAKVDQKVKVVNDRVSDVISRFEAYINDKSKK
jgi:hypothetical protein